MSTNTKIQWTDASWNPITGCTQISKGCKNCYSKLMSKRLQLMGKEKYKEGFEKVVCHEKCLSEPLGWKKPKMVFVNSMSDTFHKDVPMEFQKEIFDVMLKARQHTFQVLTKRPENFLDFNKKIHIPQNIWAGVTVESKDYLHRVEILKKMTAKTKFLSCEPLLGPLSNLCLDGINWLIVGGESGSGSRSMNPDWVREIRDQCLEANIPFFFKQWSGYNKKKSGRILDGRTWNEFPNL